MDGPEAAGSCRRICFFNTCAEQDGQDVRAAPHLCLAAEHLIGQHGKIAAQHSTELTALHEASCSLK